MSSESSPQISSASESATSSTVSLPTISRLETTENAPSSTDTFTPTSPAASDHSSGSSSGVGIPTPSSSSLLIVPSPDAAAVTPAQKRSFWSVAAINILLPFVNGLMLGFGELLGHEIAFRLGWGGTKVFPSWRATRPVGPGVEVRQKPQSRRDPDLYTTMEA